MTQHPARSWLDACVGRSDRAAAQINVGELRQIAIAAVAWLDAQEESAARRPTNEAAAMAWLEANVPTRDPSQRQPIIAPGLSRRDAAAGIAALISLGRADAVNVARGWLKVGLGLRCHVLGCGVYAGRGVIRVGSLPIDGDSTCGLDAQIQATEALR